jgi:hypothetical protein
VAELGLHRETRLEEPLARRPLRWILHRLALALAPIDADDPAALAFAGLGPAERAPDLDEEPPTDAELVAVGALANRAIEALAERLPTVEPPEDMLELVIRRRAEIVADPGWIELRFPFEEVSVELRRAGLDLDPGFVPWLGAVVRFLYV